VTNLLRVPGNLLDGVISWAADRLRSQRWVWIIPFAVLYAMVRWPTGRIEEITGGIVALVLLAWAIRQPGRALIALIIFLPIQPVLFGFLLAAHVPSVILRPAGGLKELLGVGILISALHALHIGRTRFDRHHQLDSIDKALLGYVAVATLYLLLPHFFSTFPDHNTFNVRLLSWRADCGYVLLFFAVRHAPISGATRRRFVQALIAMAVLTVLVGLYQWAAPNAFQHLILVTGRQVQYQTTVLGNSTTTVNRNLGYLTNFNPLRVGSIFLSPFDMADFLLIAFAISIERIARNFRSRSSYFICAIILAALFASRVRADALAAVIIALIALVPAPNRPITARLRLLAAILVAAAVVVPSLGGTRFVDAQGGSVSNGDHVTEITTGLDELYHSPLGLGIGNVAGVGDRFVLTATEQGDFTVDNTVLQVGDELGIQALVPWLVLLVLIWLALGRAARRSDAFAGGVRLAFVALMIAGLYHQVFLGFPVAWSLWAAMGLALRADPEPPAPVIDTAPGRIADIHAAPGVRPT
jgi:hypothetical protein